MAEADRSDYQRRQTLAIQLYTQACEGGDVAGCWKIAGVTFFGWAGAPRDPVKAEQLYHRACVGGISQACLSLRSFQSKR